MSEPSTLDRLPVGGKAVISGLNCPDAGLSQRLLEMGLFEGEPVEVAGVAPLGDPIRIRLRDYSLSLRKTEAACIVVTCP